MKKNIWFYIVLGNFLFFLVGALTVTFVAIKNPPQVITKADPWK